MQLTLKYDIPGTLTERSVLRQQIQDFMFQQNITPPLSFNDLHAYADEILVQNDVCTDFKAWVMVEVNNCVWCNVIASIPYERRILLLPKCLSNSNKCSAEFDELGLLCHRCSSCNIPNLQDEADKLGMMSIVAEGFTSVIPLIEQNVVDAIIGVSCLDSLEKAFTLLVNNAVPGLAIPLNSAGCKDTSVDVQYLLDLIRMRNDSDIQIINHDELKQNIKQWFSPDNLKSIMGSSSNSTLSIAQSWVAGEGKRWRPYLLTACYMALTEAKNIPFEIQLATISVECFHKASLVHDDIQDKDSLRYGKPTVHALHGNNIAINVGDVLLGEGYRILTKCGNLKLIEVAAQAHIDLCKGQGMELEWSKSPREIDLDYVLEIFKLKTVPAFDVALTMGVMMSTDDNQLIATLKKYSTAMGIAYQLKDDIDDFNSDSPLELRPSAVLAILCKNNSDKYFLIELLNCNDLNKFLSINTNKPLLDQALSEVKHLATFYHNTALEALNKVNNTELKRLLFRLTSKILS